MISICRAFGSLEIASQLDLPTISADLSQPSRKRLQSGLTLLTTEPCRNEHCCRSAGRRMLAHLAVSVADLDNGHARFQARSQIPHRLVDFAPGGLVLAAVCGWQPRPGRMPDREVLQRVRTAINEAKSEVTLDRHLCIC